MTCQEIAEFLMDYLTGELDATQHQCFEEHLAECPDCVAYLDSYRDTIKAGKVAFVEVPATPRSLPEEMIHAILAACKQGSNS